METSLKVANPWADASIFVREHTQSTMDDARRLALDGCVEGTVVVAGFQQKGRGRAPGRTWHSPAWASLTATIVLDAGSFNFPLAQLPLRAAVAACRAVEDSGVRAQIKWPNDILVEGKKLAGILCETCGTAVLVGIGVNCTQKTFPAGLADVACSILQVTGREINPLSLLPVVLSRLKGALGDEQWRDTLLDRLASKGERVRMALPHGEAVEGILEEVDEQGKLIVKSDSGDLLRIES